MTEQPANWTPPQKTRKPFSGKVILAIVGTLLLGLCVFGVAYNATKAARHEYSGSQPAILLPSDTPSGVSPSPNLLSKKLEAKDLRLTVKVNKKDCFGDAGCNVEYQIKMAAAESVPAQDCAITYQVDGLEDSQIGTLQLHADGKYEQESFQAGQISSSSRKLTAKVTSVDCG